MTTLGGCRKGRGRLLLMRIAQCRMEGSSDMDLSMRGFRIGL
jgi:hypothetical protein